MLEQLNGDELKEADPILKQELETIYEFQEDIDEGDTNMQLSVPNMIEELKLQEALNK